MHMAMDNFNSSAHTNVNRILTLHGQLRSGTGICSTFHRSLVFKFLVIINILLLDVLVALTPDSSIHLHLGIYKLPATFQVGYLSNGSSLRLPSLNSLTLLFFLASLQVLPITDSFMQFLVHKLLLLLIAFL